MKKTLLFVFLVFATETSACCFQLSNDTVTTYANDTVSSKKRVYGGNVLTSHHVEVTPTGKLRMSASESVVITKSFSVEHGGTLEIYGANQYLIENEFDPSGNLKKRKKTY